MRIRVAQLNRHAEPTAYDKIRMILKQKNSRDLLALYVIYCQKQWFGDEIGHGFIEGELQWPNSRFKKAQRKLIELGLLEERKGNDL
jgi:hypothetical protein